MQQSRIHRASLNLFLHLLFSLGKLPVLPSVYENYVPSSFLRLGVISI